MKGRSLDCFVHAVILTASHLYANAFTTAIFGRASAGPRSVLTNLREQTATNSEIAVDKKRKTRIVVVGGGWAGYSFCESISTNNINDGEDVEIILLDASKQARGGLAGGYRELLLR